MSELYQDFVEAVFGSGNSQGRPKLVIAVDEAQAMSEKQQCYTPSYYLCHALSELVKLELMRSYPIWTIFCSTSLSLLSRFVAEPQTFRELVFLREAIRHANAMFSLQMPLSE